MLAQEADPPRLRPRMGVLSLDSFEGSNQSYQNVRLLRQHHLLRRARAWPAQEWDECPYRAGMLPPLRPEHRGIGTPEVLILVQGPHASHQMVSLAHEDGCPAACATACRQNRVL